MTEFELAQRLGVAIAIGALVGSERHWRRRDEDDGQRTAGLRTFTLIGMMGGLAGVLEVSLRGTGQDIVPGLAATGLFIVFSTIFAVFQYREKRDERSYSVTSVVAAMLTFLIGTLAVVGDMRLAGAAGIIMVAILAAREVLHGLIERVTFVELRSAIVLLAMTFVILPVVPDDPIGPFGGVSPSRVWSLAILVAAISFVGYIAVRIVGDRYGELISGAVAGLLSSTAATLTQARRSAREDNARLLATGALAACVVSYLRTGLLVIGLAPQLAVAILPVLGAGATAMAAVALVLARGGGDGTGGANSETSRNPFDLWNVMQIALLLAAFGFAARAAAHWFGDTGVIAASAVIGLGDVDAPVITIAGLARNGLNPAMATLAVLAAVLSNSVAKAGLAAGLGSWRFATLFAGGSVAALGAGLAAYLATAALRASA
ncbi:MgtC/SapB family protein [Phreatobacter sp.]|uniref:MgtC/SapB family protein n=1 Tax=Phreatobacter sp. TaxID=1966341 RepID=UPI003F72D6F3